MTARPDLTPEHYLDALALCRATLRNDDPGIIALASGMDVAMTFQALVRMHLQTLTSLANGNQLLVDQHLGDALTALSQMEPPC